MRMMSRHRAGSLLCVLIAVSARVVTAAEGTRPLRVVMRGIDTLAKWDAKQLRWTCRQVDGSYRKEIARKGYFEYLRLNLPTSTAGFEVTCDYARKDMRDLSWPGGASSVHAPITVAEAAYPYWALFYDGRFEDSAEVAFWGVGISSNAIEGQGSIKAVVRRNHLVAGRSPRAYLRPLRFSVFAENPWIPARVSQDSAAAGEALSITPPKLPSGRYCLRVIASPSTSASPDVGPYADFDIAIINPADRCFVRVACNRQRQVFQCGEDVEFAVTCSGKEPTDAGIGTVLVDPFQHRFPLPLQNVSTKPGESRTLSLLVSGNLTRTLMPGRYRVLTRWAGAEDAYDFELISPLRRSSASFFGTCMHKFNVFDTYNYWVWPPSEPAVVRARRHRTDAFFVENLVTMTDFDTNIHWGTTRDKLSPYTAGDLADDSRLGRTNLDIAFAEEKSLPPAEADQVPSTYNFHWQESVRAGAGIFNRFMSFDSPAVEPYEPGGRGMLQRTVSLHAQNAKTYPTFQGMDYGRWFSLISMGAARPYVPPQEIQDLSRDAAWKAFQQQTGFTGARPTGGWNTYSAQIPSDDNFNSRTHPELFRQWTHFVQDMFPRSLGVMGDALHAAVPSAINSSYLYTGTRYEVAYAPSNVGYMHYVSEPDRSAASVDMILACKEGSDQFDDPHALAMTCALFYNAARDGKPIRAMGEEAKITFLNPTGAWRFLFEGLANGASSGFFDASDRGTRYHEFVSNTSDIWTHGQWGARERWQTYLRFIQQYGTAFQECQNRSKVGLLALESVGLRYSGLTAGTQKYGGRLYQAFVSLTLAGLEPVFVYEHNVLAGVHPEIQALVAVGVDADLPAEVTAGLQRFQQRGGAIFADSQSKGITLSGVTALNCSFSDHADFYVRDFEKQHRGTEVGSLKWMAMRRFALRSVPELREKMWPVVPPAVESDNPFVVTNHLLAGKDATYYFALNSTPAPWQWVAEMPRKIYLLHQFVTSPVRCALKLRDWQKRHVYSLTEARDVTADLQKRQGMVEAEFDRVPAHILLSLAHQPKVVDLKVSQRVKLGENVGVEVRVIGDHGKTLAAALPLEITVTLGQQRRTLYRATSREGILRMDLPAPVNSQASGMEIQARELVTGLRSRARTQLVGVDAGTMVVSGAAWAKDVVILELPKVQEFLQQRQLVIPLADPAPVSDFAKAIRQAGGSTRIVGEDASAEREGRNWREANLRDQLMLPEIRIPHHLAIFSILTKHPLLPPLVEADFLPRVPTEHYPGKGRCLVMLLGDAYAPGYSTLVVVGGDADGLAKGLVRLTNMIAGKPVDVTDPWRNLESTRAALLPQDVRQFKKLPEVIVPKTGKLASGTALPRVQPDWPREVGHNVYSAASSPDGKRVVAGTDSPRENLHTLDGSGRVTGSRKAEGLYVHQVATTDAGLVATGVTFPPSVQVTDASGRVLWKAVPQTEDVLWGGLYTDNVPPEPDYFTVNHATDSLVMSTPGMKLECREMATGKTLWTHDYSHTDPLYRRQVQRLRTSRDGGRLFVSLITYWRDAPDKPPYFEGGGSIDYRGADRCATPEIRANMQAQILCLDPRTGQVLWRREFEPFGELQMIRFWMWENESHGYWAPPCTGVPNSWDPLAWFRMKGRMGYGLDVTPDGSRVAAADENGNIAILDGTGQTIREFKSLEYFNGIDEYLVRPVVKISLDGSYVAAMTSQCFDRELRKFEWENNSWLTRSRVYLFDMATGAMSRGPLTLEAVSDLVIADEGRRVVFGRWDGTVNALSPKGEALWSTPIIGGCKLSLRGNQLLCTTSRGQLYCLSAVDGKVLWSADLNRCQPTPLPSYAELSQQAWWTK